MKNPIQRARTLRHTQTDTERLLWRNLRDRQLANANANAKFKRQQPLGTYIVDFVCFEARLIIELDGGQRVEQLGYDARRTAWLEAQGFTVLRFWNNAVFENLPGVLETILAALQAFHPHPRPLPRRGGGE